MKHPVFAVACALLLLAGAPLAWAAKPPPRPAHPQNLEQAVKQVQHQTRGHILAADTVSRGRSSVYRIKVLTPQGQVRVMQLHSAPHVPPRPSEFRGRQPGGH